MLADEINRATPKTQSALLEAMEERQVTVDGVTHPLPPPFLVIATQNSIEYEGTFPLPEAQLDRFLMRINVGYPRFEEEITIIAQQEHSHPILDLESVATPEQVLALQQAAQEVYVDSLVREYLVVLAEATREHADAALGGIATGVAGPVPYRASAGAGSRPGLRTARRHQGAGGSRAVPSHRAHSGGKDARGATGTAGERAAEQRAGAGGAVGRELPQDGKLRTTGHVHL